MLNFRNSTIGALIAALLIWLLPVPGWLVVIVLFIYLGVLVWGSIKIQSQFYTRAICEAKTSRKQIAISFDDGPLPEYTIAILDILKLRQVPASFFCIGNRVGKYPVLARRIVEEGHIIGNHSYSHHALFDLYPSARILEELRATNNRIFDACGNVPRYFRPPYGVTNPNVAKAIKMAGMTTIGWNIRSFDTVARNEQNLLDAVMKQVRPGAIVLFHDTMMITQRVLSGFIDAVKQEGYEIVPLDQLIQEPAYT